MGNTSPENGSGSASRGSENGSFVGLDDEWLEQFNIQKSPVKNKKLKAYKQRRKQFPVTKWSIQANKWLEGAIEKEIELDEIEDKFYWPLYALTTEPKKLSDQNLKSRFERKDSKPAKAKNNKSGRSRSFPIQRPKSLSITI